MKKYVKIALVVVVAAIFVGTFAFCIANQNPKSNNMKL